MRLFIIGFTIGLFLMGLIYIICDWKYLEESIDELKEELKEKEKDI